jgi:hypothetical protein
MPKKILREPATPIMCPYCNARIGESAEGWGTVSVKCWCCKKVLDVRLDTLTVLREPFPFLVIDYTKPDVT